jgi:NAD+ diphosphatase
MYESADCGVKPRRYPGSVGSERRRFRPGVSAPTEAPEQVWCFVFRRRELLVTREMTLAPLEALEEAGLETIRSQYLGRYGEVHCHSAELPGDAPAPRGMVFRDLRSLYGQLDPALHELASRAVQIVEWDRTHQFCGACGQRTERSDSERTRSCPECGLAQFPRLSPAIIVSVERDDRILLARSPHFPPGIFSVLAGFVEPGESLEGCVEREVLEETGIRVTDARYFGSQPWPYPNSLMLGFTARYESGEIRVDGEEVTEAHWFRADEMPRTFPGDVSISQWLIRDFLERNR